MSEWLDISVVVPTRNRADGLRKCLQAIVSQAYPGKFEIIVVDDGSTDHTARVVNDVAHAVLLRESGRGPAAARNRGIEAASGAIVAFTDDDCLPPPDWLRRLAEGYAKYPCVAGVGGYVRAPADIERSTILARFDWHVALSYGVGDVERLGGFECPAGGTSNMSYRREILRTVGGFDERFPLAAGEDADLKWRICAMGATLLYVPVEVLHLREYTWRGFVRQHIQRGRGVAHYELMRQGRRPGPGRIFLRLAKRTALLGPHLFQYRERRLAIVELLAGWLDCWGQWQAWRESVNSR